MREVLVELEPPDNIALAKIEVDSASTRAVQATIFPPLGIVFEENGEGDIVVTEAWEGGGGHSSIIRHHPSTSPSIMYTHTLGMSSSALYRKGLFM